MKYKLCCDKSIITEKIISYIPDITYLDKEDVYCRNINEVYTYDFECNFLGNYHEV